MTTAFSTAPRRQQLIPVSYVLAAVTVDSGHKRRPFSDRGLRQITREVEVDAFAEGTLDAEVFPWATQMTLSEPIASHIALTQDGVTIHRHPKGIRAGEISLSGFVGPLLPVSGGPLAAEPGDETGAELRPQPPVAESLARLDHIREIIGAVARDTRLTLYLYAVEEQRAYEVEARQWRPSRSPGRRTMIDWAATFRVLREVDPLKVNALAVVAPQAAADTNALQRAARAVVQARAQVTRVIGVVEGAVESFDSRFVAPLRSIINESLAMANDVLRLGEDLSDYAAGISRLPLDVERRVANLANRAANLAFTTKLRVYGVWRDTANSRAQRQLWGLETFALSQGGAGGLRDALFAANEYVAALEEARLAAAVAVARERGQVVYVPVRRGDTLAGLALRYLGAAEAWRDIAAANGLRYPYVAETRADGVAGIGDRLLIPGAAAGSEGATLRSDDAGAGDIDAALFGRDLRASHQDWDLVWREFPDGSVDFDDVVGLDCYAQSQDTRTQWERGENPIFPTRGIPDSIGLALPAARAALTSLGITAEIQADDRVVEVRGVRLQDQGDTLLYHADVVLVNGQESAADAGVGG